MSDALWTLDATAQAELVRSRELSAEELVDSAIARIEALNPSVGAVTYTRFDEARVEAKGSLSGPFAGVPILLKDLGGTAAGQPHHRGNITLKQLDIRPGRDSAIVRRLKEAGFVLLGRTNTPEFGLISDTVSPAYGATRNPWNLERSPGGSSGGSAAAVACGMVAVAHGSDGGGSIRMPASHCGLVGLKPSRGRISEAPVGDRLLGHNASGVLTRTVRDTAALLDVLAGPEPGDTVVAPTVPGGYVNALAGASRRLRIGVATESPSERYPTSTACSEAVRKAAATLTEAGHVVDVGWPEAIFDEQYHRYWLDTLSTMVTLAVAEVEALAEPEAAEFDVVTHYWNAHGQRVSGYAIAGALVWIDDFRRRMASWWESEFDLLLTPVLPTPPAPSGHFWSYPEGIDDSIGCLQFTPHFNTTGQPAISVPMSWTDDGLPVGVQLVARYGEEHVLLAVAAELEQRNPWADRYPAIATGAAATA